MTATAARPAGSGAVAVVLAVALGTALNLFTIGAILESLLAIQHDGPGISENATQILTGAFGGIVGIVGAMFGYQAGRAHNTAPDAEAVGGGVPARSGGNPLDGAQGDGGEPRQD